MKCLRRLDLITFNNRTAKYTSFEAARRIDTILNQACFQRTCIIKSNLKIKNFLKNHKISRKNLSRVAVFFNNYIFLCETRNLLGTFHTITKKGPKEALCCKICGCTEGDRYKLAKHFYKGECLIIAPFATTEIILELINPKIVAHHPVVPTLGANRPLPPIPQQNRLIEAEPVASTSRATISYLQV